ncbi:TonB-dependent receptor [candidate division KSB1 bacterium]|nr:TonB-dependent receptor [candidate division KSB1 bacterium]
MNKKLLFTILLLICMVPYLFAGITGKIAGKITDAETGEPLPGANIVVQGTMLGAASDREGDYFIINVPPGTYTLEASMMGYTTLIKSEVIVKADITQNLDFALGSTALLGEEVTVVAERDVIAMDVSASQVSLGAADVNEIPNVTSVEEAINLQMGVDYDPTSRAYDERAEITIRGGGRGQNALMVDGLMMVDNRANRPMMLVNLSTVKEINIIKGGFNAEYGNVRSGLVNIVTKEGDPKRYSGSIDFRLTPGHLKHFGESIFDPDNYYLRPFLDEAVCWEGTDNGAWDAETQARYRYFMGWNEFAKTLEGVTPEQARDIFIWQHRCEGAEELGRDEGSYGDKPDWVGEASFGGPVPFIGEKLGDLSFFASHRSNYELFALPTLRDYYQEQTSQLKLTSHLNPSMKIILDGIYAETHSVSAAPRGSGMDAYMTSGIDILYSPIATGADYVLAESAAMYNPYAVVPFDVYSSMLGLGFDHVLSPSTFYNFRVSHTRTKNFCNGPRDWRDETIIRYFGDYGVDETPLGYKTGIEVMFDGMSTTGDGATRDWSEVNTLNVKFDLTSQVNKYNQLKTGFEFNYDDLDMHYEHNQIGDAGNNWQVEWKRYPYRGGAYIQDKLEFKGMIANFGLRLDMNNPNSKAFVVDRFSMYFRKKFMDTFQDLAPYEDAKVRWKLSPRLGISHPISDKAKLYFNYGHFYSVPTNMELFLIMKRAQGLSDVGNPNADLARTVAYELGVEYDVSDMFLLHLSGYYKDITDQLANINYVGFDGGVNYWSHENNNYQDIRGFEARVEKRFGKWVMGWANYNYMVTTSGYVGRQTYYEDQRRQVQEGLMNPVQERPQARPIARANISFFSPNDFGPTLGSFYPFGDLRLDVLYQWRAGRYEGRTNYQNWNPVGDVDVIDELQWKGRTMVDMRLRKNLSLKGFNFALFMEVTNLFNFKYLEEAGFANLDDRVKYMRSLRLERYNGDNVATKEEYEAMGYKAGDDKPGDVKSDDKPWIDMPNREFLTYYNPRAFTFGLQVNF